MLMYKIPGLLIVASALEHQMVHACLQKGEPRDSCQHAMVGTVHRDSANFADGNLTPVGRTHEDSLLELLAVFVLSCPHRDNSERADYVLVRHAIPALLRLNFCYAQRLN